MGRVAAIGLALACGSMTWSCGEEAAVETPSVQGSTHDPCVAPASSGAVTAVDLRVDSPLPSVMMTSCPHGSHAELGARLFGASATGACILTVASGAVTGCCPNVAADGYRTLTLAYELDDGALRLAYQMKDVLLNSVSPPVFDVSFAGETLEEYDSDNDGADNVEEWCAGTL